LLSHWRINSRKWIYVCLVLLKNLRNRTGMLQMKKLTLAAESGVGLPGFAVLV